MKKLWLGFLICLMVCAVFGAQAGLAVNSRDWPTRDALSLPDNLEIVGEEAFCNIGAVQYVYVPDGAKRIEARAFAENDIREVFLPESIEYIASDALEGCSEAVCIVLQDGNAQAACEASGVPYRFDSDLNAEFTYTVLEDGTVRIDGCNSDEASIIVPATIEGRPVTVIGNDAFDDASHHWLQRITLPPSITTIENCAFWGSAMREINIPNSVETIGVEAFIYCRNLQEVILPEKVTVVPHGAFAHCSALKRVVLKGAVTEFGNVAFMNCMEMEEIELPDSVEKIGENAFNNCKKMTNVNLTSNLQQVGRYAFQCTAVTSVVFPEGFGEIPDGMFAYCEKLEEVKFPQSLKRIGGSAFNNCELLKDIELPPSLEEIGYHAFSGCKLLEVITIPASVQSIASSAFSGCPQVLFICELGTQAAHDLGEGGHPVFDPDVPDYWMYQAGDDTGEYLMVAAYIGDESEVIIPKTMEGLPVIAVGGYAFYENAMVTRIDLQSGMEAIGECAFSNCPNLARVYIPKSVTYIEDGIVEGSPNVTVYVKRSSTALSYCKQNKIPYKTY